MFHFQTTFCYFSPLLELFDLHIFTKEHFLTIFGFPVKNTVLLCPFFFFLGYYDLIMAVQKYIPVAEKVNEKVIQTNPPQLHLFSHLMYYFILHSTFLFTHCTYFRYIVL